MEKTTLYEYQVEGSSNLDEFAKSILQLTNHKSNDLGVVDFRTFEGTNEIHVITKERNDSYVESYFGKILFKGEIEGILIESDDVSNKVLKEIDKALDENKDFHVILDRLY